MGSGKIVKPNEQFLAYPDEIPAAFRDVLKPVEPLPSAPAPSSAGSYSLRKKSDNWYDIVDDRGKTVNEKPLQQDEATEILEKLE